MLPTSSPRRPTIEAELPLLQSRSVIRQKLVDSRRMGSVGGDASMTGHEAWHSVVEYDGAKDARMLVVDDDPLNVELLCAYLEDDGYRTYAAYSGSEALATAANDPPD